MVLSNAQKQQRWRARNQVILTADAETIAEQLIFMDRKKLRAVITRVNRYLKQTTGMSAEERSNHLFWREQQRLWREAWLRDHPGRTAADYARAQEKSSEMEAWGRAKGRAAIAAENEAWLRDHPGRPLPEHLCSLSDAEYRQYERWRRLREAPDRRRGP